MNGALKRFRVMAWVVGVMLLVLVVIAVPLRYAFGHPTMEKVVGQVHGFLYIVFLVTAFDLAVKAKWPFLRTLGVLFCGVIPGLSFYVERKVTGWVRTESPSATPTSTPTSA